MTGTAAEVTPIRSVDDHEVGPPGRSRSRCRRHTWTRFAAGTTASGPTGSTTPTSNARTRRDVDVEARSRSSLPYLDEREEELVLEVLRSGRLSLGPMIDALRSRRSPSASARRHAAAVSSGTAGLHLSRARPASGRATR